MPLTALETQLLQLLAQERGRPVSRDRLLVEVWGFPRPVRTRAVDNTVSRLRAKLERDPAEPDHLKSVRGVGYLLELEGPAPAAPAPLRRSLPLAPASRAFGMDGRLAALQEAWSSGARAVALVGPGGSGKTRLALRWAEETAPHAVWLQLGGRPALELGAALDVGADALDRALEALCVPVVLDEAEGCWEALREVLPRWLQAAPQLRVLITSRQSLGLPAVHELRLVPLALPASRALFLDRLRVAAPGRRLSADEDAALDAWLALQDGSPLALELAAAQAVVTPVHELWEQRRRAGPGGGVLPAPLARILDETWAGLPARAQDALVALGAWRCPMSVAQLAVVLGCSPAEASTVAGALVAAGMARTESAGPPLEAAGGEVVVRVLDAVRTLASARGDQQPGRAAQADRQNGLLVDILEGSPPGLDGRRLLARHALDAVDAARRLADRDPARAARIVLALRPHLAHTVPEPAVADLGIDCARATGDALTEARALLLRARLCAVAGQRDQGLAACGAAEQALDRLPPEAPRLAWARALLAAERASLAELLHDHAATLAAWKRAAALAEHADDPRLLLRCRHQTVPLMAHLDGPAAARTLALQVVREARRLRDPELTRNALLAVAFTEINGGRADAACETLEEAVAASPRSTGGLAVTVRAIYGWVLQLAGRLDEAEEQLEVASAMARAAGIPSHLARSEGCLGVVALERGAVARARAHLEASQDAAVACGVVADEAQSDLYLALCAALEGRDSARRRHRDAAEVFFGGDVPRWFATLPPVIDTHIAVVLQRPGAREAAEALLSGREGPLTPGEVVPLRMLRAALGQVGSSK